MSSHPHSTAPAADTTALDAGRPSSPFSSTVQLTLEEKEIKDYLDHRLNRPRGGFFDTVNERLERYEPLARSIEEMLEMEEFKAFVDESMEETARQVVNQFRARKSEIRSGIFGKIPMFAVLSAADEFGMDLQSGYLDLKSRISTEWRARKLAAGYMRNIKIEQEELKQQKEGIVRDTEQLQAAYKGVHTQFLFFTSTSPGIAKENKPKGRMGAYIMLGPHQIDLNLVRCLLSRCQEPTVPNKMYVLFREIPRASQKLTSAFLRLGIDKRRGNMELLANTNSTSKYFGVLWDLFDRRHIHRLTFSLGARQ
ncbi:hypothetical protein FRC01_001591 [Tulasnella sp. 417]|nr:hypothetical protein FRC01_001591 [Tulasnella sp. 417]